VRVPSREPPSDGSLLSGLLAPVATPLIGLLFPLVNDPALVLVHPPSTRPPPFFLPAIGDAATWHDVPDYLHGLCFSLPVSEAYNAPFFPLATSEIDLPDEGMLQILVLLSFAGHTASMT